MSIRVFTRLTGTDPFIAAVMRKARRTDQLAGDAIVAGSQLVAKAMRARIHIPREVSVQDAPARRRLNRSRPVAIRVDRAAKVGYVQVRSYPGAARSPAVSRAVRAAGKANLLDRPALYVNKRNRNKSKRYETRAGLERVSLRDPKLRAWAAERGMIRRTVLYLPAQARLRLVAAPGLAAEKAAVIQLIRDAAVRGLSA